MKTVSVALVLCLNVGVDPPDVVKTSPCARLECWIGMIYFYAYIGKTGTQEYFEITVAVKRDRSRC